MLSENGALCLTRGRLLTHRLTDGNLIKGPYSLGPYPFTDKFDMGPPELRIGREIRSYAQLFSSTRSFNSLSPPAVYSGLMMSPFTGE